MPGLDGTGPLGYGPMTGRGLGLCRGGAGCGLRRAAGFGFRRFRSPGNELAALEDEEKMLQDELKALRDEISSLKGEQK
ncbi:MAG: hypothetical protein BWY68_00150 [bacterium ADurb.Bin400]|nr:MAG: hypothetical protein BWY68_00150 [bacterium ADurb.Bin400]